MALILTVDDEETILQVLSSLLKAEGHKVIKASDGQSAIEMIEANEGIDLVISDVRMRPISGIDLLKVVKMTHPELPVIMVTAYYSMDVMNDVMELGAFAYLSKPFKPFELLHKVNNALSGSSHEQAPPA
jgi:DNA-binding NtrC family response regulator